MTQTSHTRTARPRRHGHVLVAILALAAPAFAGQPSAGSRQPLREDEVPAYAPVTSADPVVGRIEIPCVGVSSPILEGVDYRTIRRAVGHFPGTPLPSARGNVALAAHRTTDFYGLRDIRLGDEITLTSRGRVFRYVVSETWVVDPDETWVVAPSPERLLTLVTCYPFDYHGTAPRRFVVRARAVDAPRPAAAEPERLAARAPETAGPAAAATATALPVTASASPVSAASFR
jgi:sortase A